MPLKSYDEEKTCQTKGHSEASGVQIYFCFSKSRHNVNMQVCEADETTSLKSTPSASMLSTKHQTHVPKLCLSQCQHCTVSTLQIKLQLPNSTASCEDINK